MTLIFFPRFSSNYTFLKLLTTQKFFSTEGLKKVNVKQLVDSVHLVDTLSVENGGLVEFGGWWEPKHCKPRTKVRELEFFKSLSFK